MLCVYFLKRIYNEEKNNYNYYQGVYHFDEKYMKTTFEIGKNKYKERLKKQWFKKK